MDLYIDQEQALLQSRVDELEGRLAQLEKEIRRMRGEQGEQSHGAGNGASGTQLPLGGATVDGAPVASIDRGESEQEGARLVVIEMLTSGYTRDQIAVYLSQTFAVEDPETLLAESGAPAG